MADDESKDIFESRLLFSITNDMGHIDNIVKKYLPSMEPLYSKEKVDHFVEFVKDSCKNKKIIIYGAGKVGQLIESLLKNIKIECFSDINADLQFSGVNGIPVISPKTLVSRYCENVVVILAVWKQYHKELIEFFTSHGIAEKDIINGMYFLNFKGNHNNQYFEPNLINYVNDEIFIDAGSFDFNSSISLAKRCNTLKKIYAFEPDKKNMMTCLNNVNDFTDCEVRLFEAGLWSCNDTLNFNLYGGGGSCIAESGNTKVPVIALDDVIDEDGVTFIKMDIEGAELEALKGASKTIKLFKPKLAISLYHKPEDIIDIPEYIMDLNQGYKLYIRHYTNWTVDTVLYAV
ncbi:MAG: FkbM family methyltransferase [Deltaproteobacteria bacterium]|nr:FkbM family methyltransferase [Deltaproteobacteria bacterium]